MTTVGPDDPRPAGVDDANPFALPDDAGAATAAMPPAPPVPPADDLDPADAPWNRGGTSPGQLSVAESALLGAMILSPTARADAIAAVEVDDFTTDANRTVFQAISELETSDQVMDIDEAILAEYLATTGRLDRAGGAVAVIDLTHNVPSIANVGSYVRLVRGNGLKRRFLDLTVRARSEGESAVNIHLELDRFSQELSALQDYDKQGATTVTAADAIEAALERARVIQESDSELIGVTSGIRDLDNILRGFQGGKVYTVGARPAVGKSVVALTFARAAAKAGHRVAFISLEMDRTEIGERIGVAESGVSSDLLKEGRLAEDDWSRLRAAKDRIEGWNLMVEDQTMALESVMAVVGREASKDGGLGLVVIDYLQLMEVDGGNGKMSRQEQVSTMSRSVKKLARRHDVAVVSLSQLSRESEKRNGDARRPIIADLRESGSLEQDSDVVILLYREDMYDPDSDRRGEMEMIVAKHRGGRTGTVSAAFMPHMYQVRDLARNVTDAPPPSNHTPF